MLRIYVKMLRSHTFTATYVCGIICFVFFAVCADLGGRVVGERSKWSSY
jgi:hypothetical protein